MYIFDQPDKFVIAVHVPQHEQVWSEQTLRSLVVAFAMTLPKLVTPLVVLHWIQNRVEVSIVNSGAEDAFVALKAQAEQPSGQQHFLEVAISTIAATRQFENQVECEFVTVQYHDVEDLFECSEYVSYSPAALRPVCERFLEFCKQ